MNLIYLHGFQSSPFSIKGQQLKRYCQVNHDIQIHLPDLNLPPLEVMAKLEQLIQGLEQVVLVGSSFGGFYATQCVAKYALPAVLVNPAVRPWQLFHDLFGVDQLPYRVAEYWTLTAQHLDQLKQMAVADVPNAEKILVLLQRGDETLDYREAQGYYSQPSHHALILSDAHGNHAMDDFEQKIPLILEFLTYSLK
ncbi:YqiA/YcfP family alpha/beta fold hydrolase [Acinetobacter ihumii]|uniref:YqiA/YcfP family alpha/beta fold hydrolase n=1 Tax=Acinetobacter ihumii TaxID=2483802 RepID=UPI001031BD38|nr:YqiA/YcfP family alpha/beta fold hydrolase [Acinetobacter ihumii]